MATLLDGTNDVLQRVGMIDVNGELSDLTSEPRQRDIDLIIQLWNEAIEELYSVSPIPRPNVLAEDTITLSTNTRAYSLASDLVRIHFPLLDETNGRYIVEYPGGYLGLVNDQPQPSNFTGLPTAAAIRPTDGQLYLDKDPTSNENGLTYKYRYDKDTELTDASDVMPFPDAVYRALIPVVAELWRLNRKGSEFYRPGVVKKALGRAGRYLMQKQPRRQWTPFHVRPGENPTDPLNDGRSD